MTRNKIIILTVFLLILSGCSPIIDELIVMGSPDGGPIQHGVPATTHADVTKRSGGAGDVRLTAKPLFPLNSTERNIGTIPQEDRVPIGMSNSYTIFRYAGQTDALQYGGYSFGFGVRYTALIFPSTRYKYTKILVEPPAYCFGFDQDSDGWTLGPVRDSNDQEVGHTSLGTSINNWPFDKTGHGSIKFTILSPPFPNDQNQTPYWYIDFISPDLSNNTDWQQALGISLRAFSTAVDVWAIGLVDFQDSQGETHSWTLKDEGTGRPLLYPITKPTDTSDGLWTVIQWQADQSDIPEDWTVSHVKVRIVGDTAATDLNHSTEVFLDGVCSNPPGISPPGGVIGSPIVSPW